MREFLEVIAGAAALMGSVLCLIASSTLLTGKLWVLGLDPGSVFLGGIGLLVFACLAKLYQRDLWR